MTNIFPGNHEPADPETLCFGDLHVHRGDGPDHFKPMKIEPDEFPNVTTLWNIVGGTRNEPGYAMEMVERDGVWVLDSTK